MSYLIIGASSGLGKDIAYNFAKNKKKIIIASRDLRDLKALKHDIELRFKTNVKILCVDFSNVESVKKKINLRSNIFKSIKGILFPIGQMNDNDHISSNIKDSKSLIFSNFFSISFIISNFIKIKKEGSVIGFGSVSGSLGRKVNPYYSASKRALESFFESLMIYNKFTKIYIQFYILGYLDTNLSFGKKLFLPKGSTKKLSKIVYKNRFKKNKKYYFPCWWALIIFAIKILPFALVTKIIKFFK